MPSIASSEWMLRHGSVVGSQYILFQILRFTTYLLYNRRCMKSLQYITRMRIPWLSSDSCVGDTQLMLGIAAVESLETGIHYQSLLVQLGLSTRKSTDVYEDNLSCRVSAESLKCFKKARHYQSKLRFLQDCYQQGLVEFHQTKTEHMTADLFTKALPNNDHWRHTKALLAELPTKVIEETKQADSVQASKFEAAEEGDQGEESTLLEFIGSPYEGTDERQLGRSVSYAGIIGELEIANQEENKRITFWEKNIGDISEMPESYG